MLELWSTATMWFNIPITLMMIVVLLYWLLVILGALDINLFDMDKDLDLDADVDAGLELDTDLHAEIDAGADLDADIHAEAHTELHADAGTDAEADIQGSDAGSHIGFLNHFFSFLNLGTVPLMIILSLFVSSLWFFAMASTYYWSFGNTWVAIGWYLPGILAAIFATKFLSTPIAALFKRINTEGLAHAGGQLCTMLSDNDGQKLSQGEVRMDGAPLLINVKARPGHTLEKGDKALLIEKDPVHGFYFVEKFDDWED